MKINLVTIAYLLPLTAQRQPAAKRIVPAKRSTAALARAAASTCTQSTKISPDRVVLRATAILTHGLRTGNFAAAARLAFKASTPQELADFFDDGRPPRSR